MDDDTPQQEPRWDPPFPYGYASALESMGSVAAPLLAGVSAALALFVVQDEGRSLRWPSIALALLVFATVAFVMAVQFTVRARQFAVTPPEIEAWWPSPDELRQTQMRAEQRYHQRLHFLWTSRARIAYDAAILSFLLALGALLLPSGGLGDASYTRLGVVAIALLGFAAEAAWVAWTYFASENVDLPYVGPERTG